MQQREAMPCFCKEKEQNPVRLKMTNLVEALTQLEAQGSTAANNKQQWRENSGTKPKVHLYC